MENGDIIGYQLYQEAIITRMMKSNVGAVVLFSYLSMWAGYYYYFFGLGHFHLFLKKKNVK